MTPAWPFKTAPWTVRLALAMLDAGASAAETGRKLGVDDHTVGRWRKVAQDLPPGWPDSSYDERWRATRTQRAQRAAWQRTWRRDRALRAGPRIVDGIGTRRRLQALMRLGHSTPTIATMGGWGTAEAVQQLLTRERVTTAVRDRVAAAYDALCMTPGTSTSTRRYALRHGWAPPLAWDDIDDPDEAPKIDAAPSDDDPEGSDDVDQVVVDRILARQRTPATVAERLAALDAWLRAGRSKTDFERTTGWNVYALTQEATAS